MSRNTLTLASNWQWKQRDPAIANVLDELVKHRLLLLNQDSKDTKSTWRRAVGSPSEIHVELLRAGIIPDPYLGFNEHKVQWVGKREWLYSHSFELSAEQLANHVELEFEGLDTFCTAYLNGVEILKSENMFTPVTVALASLDHCSTQSKGIVGASVQTVMSALSPLSLTSSAPQPKRALKEGKNTLLLHFKSALLEAKAIEAKYGRVRAGSCNLGDPSRVYVRKAQYGWRWDWGPELMTVGPYRPIYLHTFKTRITDLHAKASVSAVPSLSRSLELTPTLSGNASDAVRMEVSLESADGRVVRVEKFDHVSKVEWAFKEGEVALWWPVAYGQQPLYTVEVIVFDKFGSVLDKASKRIGFRRVELVQEPLSDAPGTTFLFEINGVRIFIGGSNWIPADNFLTTITPGRYRAWLQILKDGNQNMVRIWGGGVYEPDCFYDICDELGILVWQDFQFACGQYPAHKEFLTNVEAEAEANVRRLRDHPSMALWCGNNEDYQQVFQWGISTLPAVVIYEKVLPNVIQKLSGDVVPYHRGSPYGRRSVKEWDTADPTIGDIHQWDVWGGKERFCQDWDIMGGRFVSEFGLPCLPDIRTIDYWLQDTDPIQRRVQSKAMQQHNKAGSHERRLAIVMNENFHITNNLETYAYLTQLMQSEAVSGAYRSWRREWKGKGKQYCAGVIVWQLNDCWPVSSWAIVDYFLRPKPAYYTIAREMLPYTVGIKRTVEKNRENDRPRQFYEFGAFQSIGASIDVWATNSTLSNKDVTLRISCIDLNSSWRHNEEHHISLLPNQTTEILAKPCPCPPHAESVPGPNDDADPPPTTSHSVIVSAVLSDSVSGIVLARYVDWPQPYRSYDPPNPSLSISVDGEQVSISVERPAKGVVLSIEGEADGVNWSDNALDLIPGEPQTVKALGLGGRKVTARWLGSS
ncbi:beta-mannosidase [Ceratobasidium sp. AG-Ba]|nr:beta-mannosidase [Ceratobasidium sp. AG-Ba]